MKDQCRKGKGLFGAHPFWAVLAGLALTLTVAGCFSRKDDGAKATLTPLEIGWEQFKLGDFPRAMKQFSAIIKKEKPDSAPYQRAQYGLGMATWLNTASGTTATNGLNAIPVLEKAANGKADPDIAAWSALALARIPHLTGSDKVPDYQALRVGYNKVYERFPNHPAGLEARLYAIALRLISYEPADAKEALRELDAFDAQHPKSLFESGVLGVRERCYEILQQPEDQVKTRIAGLELSAQNPHIPQSDDRAQAFWGIASLAEFQVGDFATARKYYQMIPAEYEVDLRNYAVKRAMARMEKMELDPDGTLKKMADEGLSRR